MHITSSLYGPQEFPEVIHKLIDTPEMQRLRHVHQLSFVDLVFPDATHTRFSHALGVCTLAGQYARQLGFSDTQLKTIQAAALLHDVGHPAYSHALDFLFKVHLPFGANSHEAYGAKLVTGEAEPPLPDAGRIPEILHAEGISPLEVAALIEKAHHDEGMQGIISGHLDADRLDYLTRDTFNTGARIGTVDRERLLTEAKLQNGRIVFEKKLRPILEQMLRARDQMYGEVYIHKTVKIAETMLRHAARLSTYELADFYTMGDMDALNALSRSMNKEARDLSERLRFRKLLKIAYQLPMEDENTSIIARLKNCEEQEMQDYLRDRSGKYLLVAFPNIAKHATEKFAEVDAAMIPNGGGNTNYSFFNVYADKEDKDVVAAATRSFIREIR